MMQSFFPESACSSASVALSLSLSTPFFSRARKAFNLLSRSAFARLIQCVGDCDHHGIDTVVGLIITPSQRQAVVRTN
jgi:hypothetical protein